MPAWEALAADGKPPRPPLAASPARAPLVGRAAELAQLHDLLARVERKRGPHLATVIGDPGVGKSRLLRQFELELAGRHSRPLVRHGRCLPYGSSIVYWPLGEVIRAECGIIDGDPPAVGVGEALGADRVSCSTAPSLTAAPRRRKRP